MSASIITPLWYANSIVDAVQNAKKQFVQTFVFDEKVRAPMVEFVEAQREYTKEVNRTVSELGTQVYNTAKAAYEKAAELAK